MFKGINWTAASSFSSIASQLIQLAVLGRLLTPREFGIAAIVQSFVMFSQTFVDAGVSNIILFRRELAPNLLRVLFLINVACGVTVFTGVALIAPLVSRFYGQDQLCGVLRFASLSLLVMPIGQQSMFLLQKSEQFKQLAVTEIFSRVLGLIAAIVVAYSGAGLYAIPSGSVVAALVCALIFFWRRPSNIFERIGWPKWIEVKGILVFGAYQLGDRLLGLIILESDTLIIGRLLGPVDVGIYSVAKQLILRPLSLINPIVTRLATPRMAHLQENVVALRQHYMKVMSIVALVNSAIFVYLGFEATAVVTTLMSRKWEMAAPILELLLGWGFVRAIGNPLGSLLVALGQVRRSFLWSLANCLLFPSVILASHGFGLNGVAIGLSVTSILLLVPLWRFMINPLLHIGFIDFYMSIGRASIMPVIAGAIAYGLGELLVANSPLIWKAVVVAAIYGLICALMVPRAIKLAAHWER